MAAVIATERRLRMRMPGRDLVVQNVVNWRTVRGYGRQWRGRADVVWAPRRQTGGWRKRTHPEGECNQVSHETIYRSLFVQARGVLKKELLRHLRSKRSMRRSKPVDPNGDRRGHIKDIVSIRQRPAAVEDRAVPGHWEGDLLSGPNNSYIATLVERHTR